MQMQCILCCQQCHLLGITQCNHGPICYRCVYKMRVLNKNNSCPICKHQSKQIMISNQWNRFGQYHGQILPDCHFHDVFHCGIQPKRLFEKLKLFKCFIKVNGKSCKVDKDFGNIAFLKKHLKQEHKRLLCDVCLQKKTCVLEQQKLYTVAQLKKHIQRGDIDDFGNVIFMHPFCSFCKINFFDQDQFKIHMSLEHFICSVCGTQYRYTYYKDYNGLQIHYKISHYTCSDPSCVAKKFIAFKTAQDLKIHRIEVHNAGKKIDGKLLCSFNHSGLVNEQVIELKDKQGINMQDQFITLKKSKNRAIGQSDQQEDKVIDIRYFYPCEEDEEQHYHDCLALKSKGSGQDNEKEGEAVQQKETHNKKKKYVEKGQFEKQKPAIAKENESFTIEDLHLVKSIHLSPLSFDNFKEKLSSIVSSDDLKQLEIWRGKHNKKQLNSQQFITKFYEMMKKVSLKAGYQIFPHYIRTVQSDEMKDQLDYQYIKSLKNVPTKVICLLSSCRSYGQLFKKLLQQIQINIQKRINQQSLSIKKPIHRESKRLFQLIAVVRRLKTQQMANFKFASNFGVQLDTSEMIHQKIFKMNKDNIQNRLIKIPNFQFIDLYIFVKYCYQAIIHSKTMQQTQNNIHQLVLEDYLFDRPQLQKKYGPKKQQFKTLDQKVQFQKDQQQKNQKQTLKTIQKKNKNMGYYPKTNVNLNDKSQFPDLVITKKVQQNENNRQNLRQVIDNAKNKPATYQKKINELFPTLGQTQNGQEDNQLKNRQKTTQQKKQKSWWETVNQQKNQPIQEEQEVVKIRRGKGKNKIIVSSVKGIFNQ